MKEKLWAFLRQYHQNGESLLLGLSGGPDSLALYHLLLDYQASHPFLLGIAHIDHGWRQESLQEARLLEDMTKKPGVVFHLKTLDPATICGNLEAGCRKERLNFFRELCQDQGYKAVLLAHHADDMVETVLKRVLEGASLAYLHGLQPVNIVEGLTIWRPLLAVRKESILAWLKDRQLSPFQDPTNFDSTYLRARFRNSLIPLLTKEFGKNIHPALERLGYEAAEFRDYVGRVIEPWLKKIEETDSGLVLDLGDTAGSFHPLELKYLIRAFCERGGGSLSRKCLEDAARFIIEKALNKRLPAKGGSLYLHRGRIFLLLNGHLNHERSRAGLVKKAFLTDQTK